MKGLLWIFWFAFGCHHRRLSGVFMIKKRTYQVCLECGQEFGYSWTLMRPIRSSVPARTSVPLNSTGHADVPVI
jgi:hypothetical protein